MDEQDAQEIVAQAIQSARYNEAVIVTVDNPDVGDENNQHDDVATTDDGPCLDYDGNHDTQSNNDGNTNNNLNNANGQGASSGSSREIVLVACLDTENGGIVWKDAALASSHPRAPSCNATDASDSTEDSRRKSISNMPLQGKEDMGIIRHFRTKRWAIPMLNDRRRNELYDSAIRRACESLVQKRRQRRQEQQKYFNDENVDNDEVIRILDIGSGTGLLAMMGAKYATLAARTFDDNDDQHPANEKSVQQPKEIANNEIKVQVTSVEMASAMARIARQTISENGLSEKITIVENHSTDEEFAIDDARFGRSSEKSMFDASYSKSGVSPINHGNMNNRKYADICTSELLESGLIGEGVLPAIRDAWKRHLNEDAIVVPRRARVVAVIVEGKNMMDEGLNKGNDSASVNAATCFIGPDLHSFREASGGVWLSVSTSGSSDGEITLSGVNGDVEGIAVPLHADSMLNENFRDTFSILHGSKYEYDAYKLRTSESGANTINSYQRRGIKPLTDPTTVLEFDFASGLNSVPSPSGRSIANRIVPTNDGVAHAVLFWWELDLWDGEKENSTYSTAPLKFCKQADTVPDSGSRTDPKVHWQDHWQQVLFVFSDASFSGGENKRILERGSPVELVASHNDTSISFRINEYDSGSTDPRPPQRRKLNSGDQTASVSATVFNRISPTRALQLNDTNRIGILRNAILHAIRMKGQNAPILDLSDMGICAMIAAVSGAAKNVTSLESSSGQMPMLAATIMQLGNGLSDVQILQAQVEHISTEHILGGPAEIVVAEPYYEILEGWHLQEALNYFYLVRSLKLKGLVSSSSISVPSQAFVMACVVEFQDFYDAYGKAGNNDGMVAGFRHDAVNFYGARYHTYDVSLPLCQYQYKRLSKTFCIAKINYDGNNPKLVAVDDDGEGWAYTLFERTGTAHAFVCWVEYMCRTDDGRYRHENGNLFEVISTSSSSHNQGIRKLDEAIAITESIVNDGTKFCCFASFGSDPDGIEDHSFAFKMKNLTCSKGNDNGTMEEPTNEGDDQQCEDRHLSSLSHNELISEVSALRDRLDRRNVLLDVIRKAYHRDVVFVKERLADAESRGLIYATDGNNACISTVLTSVPSIDLRKTFRLFAPQECEMRIHPCWSCGGQLEVIHRESTRIVKFKHSIHLLQAKEHDLRMEVVNAKAQAREDRMRLVEMKKNSMDEKNELLEQIRLLKQEVADRNRLSEELERVLHEKEALENQLEQQKPIIQDHERLVIEVENFKGVSEQWENRFNGQVRENAKLSNENEGLVQRLKLLQNDNDALTKDLDDSRKKCHILEDKCSTLTFEVSTCKSTTHEMEGCLQKAEDAMRELDREVGVERERFESKIKKLESECSTLASRAAEWEETACNRAKEADNYRKKIEATLGGDESFDSDAAFVKINDLVRETEVLRQKDISSSNLLVSYIRTAYENCLAQEKILKMNGSALHKNTRLFRKSDKNKNEKSRLVLRHLDVADKSDEIEWSSFKTNTEDQRHMLGNLQNRLQMGQFSLEKCFENINKLHCLQLRKCQNDHKKEMEEKTSQIWELEKLLTTAIGTNRDYECKMLKICEKHEFMEPQVASLRSTLRKLRRDYSSDQVTMRHIQDNFDNLLPAVQKLLTELRLCRKRNNELIRTVQEKQNDIVIRDSAMKHLEKLLEKMTHKFAEHERLRIKITHEAATQAMPIMMDTATSADFLTSHNARVTPPPSSDSKVDDFLLPGRIWNINSDEVYPSRVTVGEGFGRSSVQFRRAIDRL